MKSKIAYLLLSAVSVGAIAGGLNATDTGGDVLLHISAVGPNQTIADYYEKPKWQSIMSGIASGNDDWLRVYAALEPAGDAGAGEDLGEAIFAALPVVPFKAIPLLTAGDHYTVQQICTFDFESSTPPGGIRSYLTRLELSLRKARTNKERKVAAECRHGIRTTKASFRKEL